jgi:hypothetical protein
MCHKYIYYKMNNELNVIKKVEEKHDKKGAEKMNT